MAQQKFEDIEKKIRDLNKRYQELAGEGFKDLDNQIKSFNGSITEATKFAGLLQQSINSMEYSFDSISSTLKNVVDDLKGNVKATREMDKSLNSLESISRKMLDHQKNENTLSVKTLKNLAQKAENERKNLESLKEKARIEIKALKNKEKSNTLTADESKQLEKNRNYVREIGKALDEKESYLNKAVELAEKEVKLEEKRQKTLGVTGKLFGSISESLKKMGADSEDIDKMMKSMRDAAGEGNGFRVMSAGLTHSSKILKESLFSFEGGSMLLTKTLKILWNIGTQVSKDTFEISKNLGVSSERAREMVTNMRNNAAASKDIFNNNKDNLAAFLELNDAFGTSLEFSQKQLSTQTKLKEVAGLTTEEASKLAEYEQLTGKSAEQVYDSIGKTNKGSLSQKKITQEVLRVSGQLAAQYKNNPTELAKAVTQAKKLGMTLEQTKEISKQLLNFEDSISSELEAELLTGQDLNLERARALALSGDTAGAAEELMKNLGPNGLQRFQKMNVIQQESYAKALGMSADELANSLVKQKALSALDSKRRNELQKEIQSLKDKGEIEKANELEKRVLAGDTVELAKQHLDAQGSITKSVEKLKDSLSSVIAGPLGKMTDTIARIVEGINKIPGIGKVMGVMGALAAGAALVGGLVATARGIFNAFRGGDMKQQVKGGMAEALSHYENPGTLRVTIYGVKGQAASILKGRNKGNMTGDTGEQNENPLDEVKDVLEGSRSIKGLKAFKSLSKLFGGKKTMIGRGLRNVAAMMGKNKGIGSQLMEGLSNSKIGTVAEGAGNFLSKAWSGIKGFAGEAGETVGKSLGGVKNILGSPIAKGFGKVLGPILTAISSISEVSSIISEARDQKAKGQKIDMGSLGQKIVKAGAYPIANLATNLIPGVGTAISIADGILSAFGMSPIKWITDNLIDLVPSEAFTGLGKLALGEKAMAKGGIVTGPTRALVGEAGPEAVIPLNQLMNEFKEMKQILTAILHKEGTIMLNGTKMGTAMAVGGYKVQ